MSVNKYRFLKGFTGQKIKYGRKGERMERRNIKTGLKIRLAAGVNSLK
jgi:hypothetical protein